LFVLIHAGVGSTYGGVPVSRVGSSLRHRPTTSSAPASRSRSPASIRSSRSTSCGTLPDDHPLAWAKTHKHASGPFCWIVGDVAPLAEPFKMKGRQGLYKVDVDDRPPPGQGAALAGVEPKRSLRTELAPPAMGGLFNGRLCSGWDGSFVSLIDGSIRRAAGNGGGTLQISDESRRLGTGARPLDFADVLLDALDADQSNQSSYAKSLGLTEQTMRHYLNGSTTPSVARVLDAIDSGGMSRTCTCDSCSCSPAAAS
jgi:hypothetical protein